MSILDNEGHDPQGFGNQRPERGTLTTGNLEILKAVHSQVERLGLNREPMSPVENQLANAILVLLNVLIDERERALETRT